MLASRDWVGMIGGRVNPELTVMGERYFGIVVCKKYLTPRRDFPVSKLARVQEKAEIILCHNLIIKHRL